MILLPTAPSMFQNQKLEKKKQTSVTSCCSLEVISYWVSAVWIHTPKENRVIGFIAQLRADEEHVVPEPVLDSVDDDIGAIGLC